MFWMITVLIDWLKSWFDIPTGDMEWHAARSPVWGTVIVLFCIVASIFLPLVPLWIAIIVTIVTLLLGWWLGSLLEQGIQDPSEGSIEAEDASLIPWNQGQMFIIGIWIGEFIFIYRIFLSVQGG